MGVGALIDYIACLVIAGAMMVFCGPIVYYITIEENVIISYGSVSLVGYQTAGVGLLIFESLGIIIALVSTGGFLNRMNKERQLGGQ